MDEHPTVCEGLANLLGEPPGLQVTGTFTNAQSCLNSIPDLQVDIVLIDANLKGMNGIDATRVLLSHHPEVKVVGLAVGDTKDVRSAMERTGAVGMLCKTDHPDHLASMLRQVAINDDDQNRAS